MTTLQFLNHIDRVFARIRATVEKKNTDYTGASENPFFNFELSEILDITEAERGIMVRFIDKVSRMATLLNQPAAVKNEPLKDTIEDAIGYLVILHALLASRRKSK